MPDDIIRIFHTAESIGSMAERNACFCGSAAVSFNVSHIDGMLQMVPLHDKANIGTLAKSGITRAFKICNTGAKASFVQEKLNVSGLTVTDDKKLIYRGKTVDGVKDARIKQILFRGGQILMLLYAAVVYEAIAFFFAEMGKSDICDVIHGAAEKLRQLMRSETRNIG